MTVLSKLVCYCCKWVRGLEFSPWSSGADMMRTPSGETADSRAMMFTPSGILYRRLNCLVIIPAPSFFSSCFPCTSTKCPVTLTMSSSGLKCFTSTWMVNPLWSQFTCCAVPVFPAAGRKSSEGYVPKARGISGGMILSHWIPLVGNVGGR